MFSSPWRGAIGWCWIRPLVAAFALLLASAGVQAVPSFARQTGAPCSACHVGAFGPQLTDFGIQFKLSGYTLSKGGESSWPLAAMLIGSVTRTSKAQESPLPDHVKANDNVALDQASLFVAGRLADHLGIFSQLTFDGVARRTALDMLDLRYARRLDFGGHAALAGLSLNNTPGASDPYNALPNWGFPYLSSAVAPTPSVGTLLDGALAQRVLGVSGYVQLDSTWYGELGTYRTLSNTLQARLGQSRDEDPGRLHGAFYGRLAARGAWDEQALAGGVALFDTAIQPDRADAARNRYRDLAADASYRLSAGDGVFTLLGNVVHERQRRDAQVAVGEAAMLRGSLTSHSLTAAYNWRNTWGMSLQHFALGGSADALLYGEGFASGRPDSAGLRWQIDWTPYGKTPLAAGLDAQWRLGLQYTAYTKFNGARDNYDGSGRRAGDNNSVYGFAWLLF